MKKLILFPLLWFTTMAFGTTLSPIQLLNPAGSSVGQALLSMGASSAPAWGNVSISTLTGVLPVANGGTNVSTASGTALDNITGFASTGFLTRTGSGTYAFQSATNGITLGNLAQAPANTVLANATGSTANVTAFVMPSCTGSANALGYTLGTGVVCNGSINAALLGGTGAASYALLASPTFTGTVTTAALTSTGNFTPSQTNGIVGTTTNNNANAGSVGEYLSAQTGPTSISSGVTTSSTSLNLTAGDWDVQADVLITPAGSTVVAGAIVGVSTSPTSFGGLGTFFQISQTAAAGASQTFTSPIVRVSLSATTTYYSTINVGFSVSTCTVTGFIFARRVR